MRKMIRFRQTVMCHVCKCQLVKSCMEVMRNLIKRGALWSCLRSPASYASILEL